jgi:hypothetical protein
VDLALPDRVLGGVGDPQPVRSGPGEVVLHQVLGDQVRPRAAPTRPAESRPTVSA